MAENTQSPKSFISLREKEQKIRAETSRRLARQRKKRKELRLLRNSEIQRKLVENSAKIREHSRYLRRRKSDHRSQNTVRESKSPYDSNPVEVQSQYLIRPQPPPSAARSTRTYCVDNLSFSDCASSFHEGRELAYTLRMQLETNTLDEFSVASTQESTVSGLIDVPPSSIHCATPTPVTQTSTSPRNPVSRGSKAPASVKTTPEDGAPEEDSLQQSEIAKAVRPPLASISKGNACEVHADDQDSSSASLRPNPLVPSRQIRAEIRCKSVNGPRTGQLKPIPIAGAPGKRSEVFQPVKPTRLGLSVIRKVHKEDVEMQARRDRECRRRQYNEILRARRKSSVKALPTTLHAMKAPNLSRSLQSAVTLINQEESSLYKDLEDIEHKLASIKLVRSMQENTNLN